MQDNINKDNQQNNTNQTLTTGNGTPIHDNQNSISAGARGPLLMQDVQLLEQMQHFNRERIPERVVHAKGSAAHGTFTVTQDITQYTNAKVFSEIGKQTQIFARFSMVAPERGSADTERDIRGFAIKFYTEEGNWDLTGNNTPVFFIRDPLKFDDFIHSQKRNPQTNLIDDTMRWDFLSLNPESMHQLTMLFSDRGIPASFANMDGFGVNTFSLINANNELVWCKFHYKSNQGIKSLTEEEAKHVKGQDPDAFQRDLFNSIQQGDFPSWTLFIQVMTQEQALNFKWNAFDNTKTWPHADFPLIEIGQLELNRNVTSFFAENEQAAFCPANFPIGIGPSPDKILQGRLMSYKDAQHYRLTTNFQQLEINRPKCPVMHYQRDGFMSNGFGGNTANYHPNSHTNTPKEQNKYTQPPLYLGNVNADRYDNSEEDNYTQAGDLWRLLPKDEQQRTAHNIALSLGKTPKEIQLRQLCHFFKADEEYGKAVEQALANVNIKFNALDDVEAILAD